jgi:hypothetical protein
MRNSPPPATVPSWVTTGSTLAPDGLRGVGAAQGIRNAALLRSTADGRARAEVGKLLESVSRSLMEDQQSSTEGQLVAQRLVTESAQRMAGSDIVDHYIAADGTLYALAYLSQARVPEATSLLARESAEEVPFLVSSDPVRFDRPASDAPTAATRPAWLDGADPRFPTGTWLCAVGGGGRRPAAEGAAFAALARIFSLTVESTHNDLVSAYHSTGATPVVHEEQRAQVVNRVTTTKAFAGVEVQEAWTEPDASWALACLSRARAALPLREQIAALDDEIGRRLEQAAAEGQAARVRFLGRAMESLLERSGLNAELRIVSPEGFGMPARHSHLDIALAFEGALAALQVVLEVEGPFAADLRAALVEGLAARGLLVGESRAPDLRVRATIRLEDGGAGTGTHANVQFARAVVQAEVWDAKRDVALASLSDARKEGHRSRQEAEGRAVRALAKKLVTDIGATVDRAVLR